MRLFFWTACSLLVVAIVGCGVPSDRHARRIAPEDVPFGLLDRDGASSTAPEPSATLTVYLISGEWLTGVERSVAAPLTPEQALDALLRGPTGAEAAAGLRSAIGTAEVVIEDVQDRRARVELGPAFAASAPSEQGLAVAQIVYTLTVLPGIDDVVFTVGGRTVEVPKPGGSAAAGPVTRADFPPPTAR